MILTEYVAKCDCCDKRAPAVHGLLPDDWSTLQKARSSQKEDVQLCPDCRALALIMLYTPAIKDLVIASSKVKITENKKAIYYDKHRFEPCISKRFQGPPEETCEFCGTDPRNLIHQENDDAEGNEAVRATDAVDVGRAEQAPRDGTEAVGGTSDVHPTDPKRT